jgi:hypothetical protein
MVGSLEVRWSVSRLVVEVVGRMEDVLWKMVGLVEDGCSS